MYRLAAHFLYCDAAHIVPKGVVELNDERIVTRVFSLNDNPETQNTVFHNGIICPDFSSLFGEEQTLYTYLKRLQQDNAEKSVWNILSLLSKLTLTEIPKIVLGKKAGLILMEGLDFSRERLLPDFSVKILL
jgi:hypothetical protein